MQMQRRNTWLCQPLKARKVSLLPVVLVCIVEGCGPDASGPKRHAAVDCRKSVDHGSLETVRDKLGTVISTLHDQRVKQLVVDGDSGVAITAAWELVRRSNAAKSDQPSVAALAWFIELVEGRTGCVVPSLWKRCVESAKRDEGRYTF